MGMIKFIWDYYITFNQLYRQNAYHKVSFSIRYDILEYYIQWIWYPMVIYTIRFECYDYIQYEKTRTKIK